MGKYKQLSQETKHDPSWEEFFNDNPNLEQVGGAHYTSKEIQPWDYMEAIMPEAEFTGYLWGNVIKYMSRWKDKGGKQDLEKAQHYLSKLLKHV